MILYGYTLCQKSSADKNLNLKSIERVKTEKKNFNLCYWYIEYIISQKHFGLEKKVKNNRMIHFAMQAEHVTHRKTWFAMQMPRSG